MKFVTFLVLALVGCTPQTKHIKKYYFSVVEGEKEFIPLFKYFIDIYNINVGRKILFYEVDPTKTNSIIVVHQGLRQLNVPGIGKGFVGLGGPRALSQHVNPNFYTYNRMGSEIIFHSMSVYFDRQFLIKTNLYTAFVLFCHEVGHGLELPHDDTNPNSVMYPQVDNNFNKDFDGYFKYVQSYIKEF